MLFSAHDEVLSEVFAGGEVEVNWIPWLHSRVKESSKVCQECIYVCVCPWVNYGYNGDQGYPSITVT